MYRKWIKAVKIAPVWVNTVEENMIIETLEGKIKAHKGDILCKGIMGELWAQKREHLDKYYNPTNIIDPEGWARYDPAEQYTVLVYQLDSEFTIESSFGKLKGKSGDWIIKDENEEPVRYWIVQRMIFERSYKILS